MERFTTGTGQKIWVHDIDNCEGEYCVIHAPSNHLMRSFPTHWRQDKALMERICPHGVGHPDPDDLAFFLLKSTLLLHPKSYYSVHGCCGNKCCGENSS